jgi:hypothetical protein
MKLNVLVLFFALSSSFTYSQKRINIILDPKIKALSLENINTTSDRTRYTNDSIYETVYRGKNMVEDTVYYDHLKNNFTRKDFSCNHYYIKDTLIIKGGFGSRFQVYGFVAKVYPNKTAQVKLRKFWGYPSYFTSRDQEDAKSEILVNTRTSKLVLNKLPNNKSDRKHIYGCVDFLSEDFFVEMKDKKTGELSKQKNTMEYKIYFDSRYLKDDE